MIKIEFQNPLTAYEVREPVISACKSVAEDLGLFAKFHQPQQRVFDGYSGERNRKRIGNGNHKNWYIDYQEDELNADRPTVLGRVVLASLTVPEIMQFGGFDYGKNGEPTPTYSFITVDVPYIPHHFSPITPTPEMSDLTYERVQDKFSVSACKIDTNPS